MRTIQRLLFREYSVCLFFLLYLIFLLPASSQSESCRYRYSPYNEPFTADDILTPNSICIYPDGRTSMADAVNGGVEIVVYWLRYLTDEAYWTGVEFDPQLLFFGTVTTCSGDSFLNADLSGGLPAVFSSQPIFGGGHSSVGPDGNPVEGSVFYWAPSACGFVELNLYFNSPDITGDLDVNLADVSCFAQDYAGSYNYRSDFNYDGIINLADVSILSSSVGTSCP